MAHGDRRTLSLLVGLLPALIVLSLPSSARADILPPECTVVGTPGPDLLLGSPGNDVLCGRGGDDVLRGFGSNDLLLGGPGDDRLVGGSGRDGLVGDGGEDLLLGGNGGDRLAGGPDADRLRGGEGNDLLDGKGASNNLGCGAGYDRYESRDGDVAAPDCEKEVEHPPIAIDDEVVVTEDTPLVIPTSNLLANDYDPDHEPFSVIEVFNPFGMVELVGDDVVYTPVANECGDGEDFDFSYVVSDGVKTNVGLVSVTVSCVYDSPVAVDDFAYGSIGFQNSVDVLDNDLNPDWAELSVSVTGSQGFTSVSVDPNNEYILFTPDGANCGNEFWIDYQVTDGVSSDIGRVTIEPFCPE